MGKLCNYILNVLICFVFLLSDFNEGGIFRRISRFSCVCVILRKFCLGFGKNCSVPSQKTFSYIFITRFIFLAHKQLNFLIGILFSSLFRNSISFSTDFLQFFTRETFFDFPSVDTGLFLQKRNFFDVFHDFLKVWNFLNFFFLL